MSQLLIDRLRREVKKRGTSPTELAAAVGVHFTTARWWLDEKYEGGGPQSKAIRERVETWLNGAAK